MRDKCYPKEYVLVVYLQREEEIEDICNLSTKIIIEHSMVSSIWIIGSSSLTTSEFVIFSVFPSVQRFDVLIDEELKNVHQSDFLTMSRSKEVKFQSIRVSEPWHIKPDKIL